MANAPKAKFQPQAANVGGKPQIISVAATAANLQSRTFWGTGAPGAATLPAGTQVKNPMYFTGCVGCNPATAPDMYFDMTDFALWICITSGSNATSVWKQISGNGGGGSFGIYNQAYAYQPGTIVRVTGSVLYGSIVTTPGTYFCNFAVPGGGAANGNMIPQWPEPTTGQIYWYMLALGPQLINICQNGAKQIFINAGTAF